MAAAIDRSTISGVTPWNSSPAPFLISRSCEGWRWRSPANYSPVLYYLSRNSVSGAICCSRLSGVQLRSTSRTSVLGKRLGKGSSEKTKFEQLVTPLLRSILQSLCGEPVDINPCQVSNLWNNIGEERGTGGIWLYRKLYSTKWMMVLMVQKESK